MMTTTLGTLVYSFFIDHLAAQKGLRPATIRTRNIRLIPRVRRCDDG